MNIRRTLSPLITIYIVSFFYTLHVALPVYVNSTFLETVVSEKQVGLIYTAFSVLTIIALILIPKLLRLIGDYYATVFFIVMEIAALIGIAAFESPTIIVTLFILSSVLVTLIFFDFDLILEGFSKNASTGSIRGWYLTSANIAWVIAPALSAVLIGKENQYWLVYLVAAALFIPGLLIFASKLEHFKDPLYRTIHFRKTLKTVSRSKDLRCFFVLSFLLQFFFTLMVIYTPIYLHMRIGFEWDELGFLFSIMLLPFLLLEAPLGRIADKYLGEKELLVAGFFIMAVATGSIYFVTGHSFALWATILFCTRVGAAMVEIMTETYFFKKVDGDNAALVGVHRTMRPVAGIVGPLVATAFLAYFPLPYLFPALAGLMLLGVPIAFRLHDTK